MTETPLISVLTPVHDPPLEYLESCIESVLEQSFEDWQLCLADDGSSDPDVRAMLGRFAAEHDRIDLVTRETAGGISRGTNAALAIARGEYIALLDHDDLLAPDALRMVADVIDSRPDVDVVYTDEEIISGGERLTTYEKPAWSPDLLRSQMYMCHFDVYRRSLAEEVGGFRPKFDGSQDYDFALRVTERTDRIAQVPRILYRWRAHPASTATNVDAKPQAYEAARAAIASHLERVGIDGEVEFGDWPGYYRLRHRLPEATSVAVVVPVAQPIDHLEHMARVLGDPDEAGIAPAKFVAVGPAAALEDVDGVETIQVEGDATRTELLARGAEACLDSDVILLLEGPVEPRSELWLRQLVGYAIQDGIAAVAPKTIALNYRTEQNGDLMVDGLPLPLVYGGGPRDGGSIGTAWMASNVSSVNGTVAIPSSTYRELGGLDVALGDMAIPDFCLRGIEAGMRVISASEAVLRRGGPAYPNDLPAMVEFRRRWGQAFRSDPYYDRRLGLPKAYEE